MKEQMPHWTPTAAAVGLVAIALFCFGVLVDSYALRVAVKPFPVLAMIAIALGLRRTTYAKTIAVGLGCCVLGDVFLEVGDAFFLYGMIAFLLGHVSYIVAFVGRTKKLGLAAALPFAIWIVWALVFLMPHLGEMQIPVSIYTIVIFAMMWRATSLVVSEESPSVFDWLAMLGAFSFGVSDTLIALDKFHAPIEGVRIPIILLYWGGQALITSSVASPHAGENETEP